MPLNRRSRLRAKAPLKRHSPLRSKGKGSGRGKDTGPPVPTRELVLERDEYRCVVCGAVIFGQPWSVHHRRNRGSGGSSDPAINSPANLLLVCGTGTTGCHGWIGERPEEARDEGYAVSLNSRQDPASVPVHHAVHGLIYLTDDGGWRPV